MQINTDTLLMSSSSAGVLLSASNEILGQTPTPGVITLITLLLQAFIVYRQTRVERRKQRKIQQDELKEAVNEALKEREDVKTDKQPAGLAS